MVVVLRSFGDRVKVYMVSVSLSLSIGHLWPWSGIKSVTRCSSANLPCYFVTFIANHPIYWPTTVKIGHPSTEYNSVHINIWSGSYLWMLSSKFYHTIWFICLQLRCCLIQWKSCFYIFNLSLIKIWCLHDMLINYLLRYFHLTLALFIVSRCLMLVFWEGGSITFTLHFC
jgi:hypothetical protein